MGDQGFVTISRGGNGPPPGQHRPPPPGNNMMQPHFPLPPPPPPRDALPMDLRLSRTNNIDIVDVSESLLSDADKRQRCTDYALFRFEKVLDRNPYDEDEDDRIKSSWEKAIRTKVQDLSKRDIEREIRRLDLTTTDVVQKKTTLGQALLRQLDNTLEELIQSDHDRANYHWTLAQVDHKLKQVDKHTAMSRNNRIPIPAKRSNTRKRRASYSAKPKKKYWERVSVTAYFKHSPRPHVDIRALYENKRRGWAMTQGGGQPPMMMMNGPHGDPRQPPHPIVHGPPPQKGPPPHLGGNAGPPRKLPQPPPPPALRPGQGLRPGLGPGPGQGQGPGRGALPQRITNVRPPQVYHESASDSGSDSEGSEGSSVFSEPTHTTSDSRSSNSSKLDKRGGKRGRSQRRSRSHDRKDGRSRGNSRHYGVDTPRLHTRREQNYILGGGARLPQAPAPPPLIEIASASDIERIQENAYIAGRSDERANNRLVDELALETRPRFAPPPLRALPPPRHVVRTIDPHDIPREIVRELRRPSYPDEELAHFERLSIDDHDLEYERDLRRYDRGRRREFSLRDSFEDEDDLVREVPHVRLRRRATEYTHRPDLYTFEPDRDHHGNPFAPGPRFR